MILNDQGEYQVALPVEGDYVITPMISEYYRISP